MSNSLDDLDILKSVDSRGMLDLVAKLPDEMEEGWVTSETSDVGKTGKINSLVISGMGGSAISGDIVSLVLRNKADFPVFVNRDYGCPKFVNSGTLFIAASYSGNTEEAISAFKEALQRGARVICVSSGGELKELSKKNNVPLIAIPKGLPPRAALGYILSPILNVLYRFGVCGNIKTDIDETRKLLKQLSAKYGAAKGSRENEIKQQAIRLHGKIPVILASNGTTSAAGLRWKTQFNENSKMTAILSVFPELDHNDLVNFSFLKKGEHNFSFIILRDDKDPERLKKRIEVTKSLISGNVGGVAEVWSQGQSALAKTMSLILYGDYLSVYLAVLSGIDPTPVEIIEKLKKELLR
ncbi:MAG: bifunctional phosphoglucose/phosphomannose isomerase [bacterium]